MEDDPGSGGGKTLYSPIYIFTVCSVVSRLWSYHKKRSARYALENAWYACAMIQDQQSEMLRKKNCSYRSSLHQSNSIGKETFERNCQYSPFAPICCHSVYRNTGPFLLDVEGHLELVSEASSCRVVVLISHHVLWSVWRLEICGG